MDGATRQKKRKLQKRDITCFCADTVYSPALSPTHPTYTIHPHSGPAWKPLRVDRLIRHILRFFVSSSGAPPMLF